MGKERARRKGLFQAALWVPLVCCLVVSGALGSVVLQAGRVEAAPTSWTVVSSPNPSGNSRLEGISCFSTTMCMTVGYTTDGSSIRTLTEFWNGNVWSIIPSPSPGIYGVSSLLGVSCPSVTSCTAVGYPDLAESWNGTAWSVTQNLSDGMFLQGVSCPSANSCTAVGYVGGSDSTFIESWNGTTWSTVPSPNVTGAKDSILNGISCTSSSSCTTVGYSYSPSSTKTLVESWDGTAWSIIPSPNPRDSTQSVLNGVSCFGATDCTSVGSSSSDDGNTEQTLVESWDGAAWSIIPSTNPRDSSYSELQGVSCLSTSKCTTVGTSSNGSLVESWDGSSWSVTTEPNPNGSLMGVSCLSATNCTTVGTSSNRTLVENGSVLTPPVITSSNSISFTDGVSGNFTVISYGAPTPSITERGVLPSGITFTENRDGTATLAGTPSPKSIGNYPVAITASNGLSPNATQSLTLKVLGLHVVTTTLASARKGDPYSSTLTAIGGTPPYVWVTAGALPPGLHLDWAGVLFGTPDQTGTFKFKVRVLEEKKYGGQSATAVITLAIT